MKTWASRLWSLVLFLSARHCSFKTVDHLIAVGWCEEKLSMIPLLADFTCIFLEIDPSSLIFKYELRLKIKEALAIKDSRPDLNRRIEDMGTGYLP